MISRVDVEPKNKWGFYRRIKTTKHMVYGFWPNGEIWVPKYVGATAEARIKMLR